MREFVYKAMQCFHYALHPASARNEIFILDSRHKGPSARHGAYDDLRRGTSSQQSDI